MKRLMIALLCCCGLAAAFYVWTFIKPDYAEAWNNKGMALGKLGRYKEELQCHDRAIEINPRYAEAWNNKGVALGNLGLYKEELECYDRAIEINPRLAEAWYNKGGALGRLERYAEVRRAFEKAAELGLPQARQMLEILKREGR